MLTVHSAYAICVSSVASRPIGVLAKRILVAVVSIYQLAIPVLHQYGVVDVVAILFPTIWINGCSSLEEDVQRAVYGGIVDRRVSCGRRLISWPGLDPKSSAVVYRDGEVLLSRHSHEPLKVEFIIFDSASIRHS